MISSFLFLLMGFLIAVLCTPWVIRLSQRGIGLDYANETRKTHAEPIPRLGGMPLMLAMSLGLMLILSLQPEHSSNWFATLLGSVLMYGLGLWDDLRPLGAKLKLAGQLLTACIVFWMGLSIDRFSYPGAAGSIELGAWSLPVTVFWLIALPNIVNLIDGFDGLAGGLGLCMSVTLGIVGLHNEQVAVACYAFTMAGALLGFLVFNFPPAKIYLGDGGAYLIGFTIAALSLTSSNKGSVAAVLFVTIVALGVPILDTSYALVRRGLRGYPLFHADDGHFHHRLEKLGFSKRRILLALYGICVILCFVGLSIIWSQGRTLPIGLCVLFILVLFVLRFFNNLRTWDDVRNKFGAVLSRRREVQYALLQAQLLELEVDRCETGEEFWSVFQQTMRRVGFVEDGEMENLARVEVRSNETTWTLHAPRSKGAGHEWQRVAECFGPVYSKAISKWRS
ncbi:MAG TPA: MraY family glycosyltransferase [Chthoniobacteraceae bacterium]|jgi:UDP-GlcNAc:undecaprenyl-phosphate GlcNAc-1-phosphate transferase